MMRAVTMQPSRDIPLPYPACPSCGRALRFARTVPGTDGLAELQTFSCRECSLWITESAEHTAPRAPARVRLVNYLKVHYASVPDDATAHELRKMAQPLGGDDPITRPRAAPRPTTAADRAAGGAGQPTAAGHLVARSTALGRSATMTRAPFIQPSPSCSTASPK
jgi:hypothetical protein